MQYFAIYDPEVKFTEFTLDYKSLFKKEWHLAGNQIKIFWTGNNTVEYQDKILVFINARSITYETYSENLLQTYKKYGDTGIDRVIGKISEAITVIIYNELINKIMIWRDKLGLSSVYYCKRNGKLLISSSINIISDNISDNDINKNQIINQIVTRFQPDKETLLSDVYQVCAGERVEYKSGDELIRTRYWSLGGLSPKSQPLWNVVNDLDVAFDKYFNSLANNYTVACVPLSGGVDSSILLAKANQHFKKCIAFTPVYVDKGNPELAQAKQFAKTLGIEHRLIDFNDEDVYKYFIDVCIRLEKLPRHFSSLPFKKLIEVMEDESPLIIYGESADSLFGSGAIKRVSTRVKKAKILNNYKSLIKLLKNEDIDVINRIRWLCNSTLTSILHDEIYLNFTESHKKIFYDISKSSQIYEMESEIKINELVLQETSQLQAWQKSRDYIYLVDVVDHFETITRLTSREDTFISAPFMDEEILKISYTLPPEFYFGRKFVKVALRELGKKYYSEEYMYRPKWGFDAPQKYWVESVLLKHFSDSDFRDWKKKYGLEELIEIDYIPKDDHQLAWSLMSLMTVSNHLLN